MSILFGFGSSNFDFFRSNSRFVSPPVSSSLRNGVVTNSTSPSGGVGSPKSHQGVYTGAALRIGWPAAFHGGGKEKSGAVSKQQKYFDSVSLGTVITLMGRILNTPSHVTARMQFCLAVQVLLHEMFYTSYELQAGKRLYWEGKTLVTGNIQVIERDVTSAIPAGLMSPVNFDVRRLSNMISMYCAYFAEQYVARPYDSSRQAVEGSSRQRQRFDRAAYHLESELALWDVGSVSRQVTLQVGSTTYVCLNPARLSSL